jgi:hypothetical protein
MFPAVQHGRFQSFSIPNRSCPFFFLYISKRTDRNTGIINVINGHGTFVDVHENAPDRCTVVKINCCVDPVICRTPKIKAIENTEGDPNLSVCRVRTVPYRFLRWTVLVDRTAYRTFLTVFRDFCLKARTLPRFKFYRFAV